MYAPANDTSIRPIVEYIAKQSGLEIVDFNPDPTKMPSGSIVACESLDQIIDFMWDYQNVTQTGTYHSFFNIFFLTKINISEFSCRF